MNGRGAGRRVSRRGAHVIELYESPRAHTNAGADTIAIAFRAFQRDLEPTIGVWTIIHPNFSRRAESGDHNVQLSVVIKVANRSAAVTPRRLGCETSLFCERGPLVSFKVAEHRVGLIDHLATRHVWRLHVSSADENILPSIVVKIGDVRAVARHGSAEQSHATFRGDIGEAQLAIISINRKSLIVESDEGDIGEAVIVQIAKVSAHSRDDVALLG